MGIEEIKVGQIFIMKGDGGHPKLKLKSGFIDMRSRLVLHGIPVLPWGIYPLTNSQIKWAFKRCGINTKGWKDLRAELLQKFNK